MYRLAGCLVFLEVTVLENLFFFFTLSLFCFYRIKADSGLATPSGRVQCASFVLVIRDCSTPLRDACVSGRDSSDHCNDSCVSGRDSHVHDKDLCVSGRYSQASSRHNVAFCLVAHKETSSSFTLVSKLVVPSVDVAPAPSEGMIVKKVSDRLRATSSCIVYSETSLPGDESLPVKRLLSKKKKL